MELFTSSGLFCTLRVRVEIAVTVMFSFLCFFVWKFFIFQELLNVCFILKDIPVGSQELRSLLTRIIRYIQIKVLNCNMQQAWSRSQKDPFRGPFALRIWTRLCATKFSLHAIIWSPKTDVQWDPNAIFSFYSCNSTAMPKKCNRQDIYISEFMCQRVFSFLCSMFLDTDFRRSLWHLWVCISKMVFISAQSVSFYLFSQRSVFLEIWQSCFTFFPLGRVITGNWHQWNSLLMRELDYYSVLHEVCLLCFLYMQFLVMLQKSPESSRESLPSPRWHGLLRATRGLRRLPVWLRVNLLSLKSPG